MVHNDVRAIHRIKQQWSDALARWHAAEQAFVPVRQAFRAAERAYFSKRAGGLLTPEKEAALRIETGLEKASTDEIRFANQLFDAAQRLFQTAAPNLTALIYKIELLQQIGYDGSSEEMILRDLRRIAGAKAG